MTEKNESLLGWGEARKRGTDRVRTNAEPSSFPGLLELFAVRGSNTWSNTTSTVLVLYLFMYTREADKGNNED